MELTVTKYLNARTGSASTDAPCYFYQSPGNTITIDDIIIGEELDGNSVWYHCMDDGCYYWSGGVEELCFEIKKLDDVTEGIDSVLNEAIKHFWNTWKDQIAGFTGASTGDKTTAGVNTQKNAIVFHVLIKPANNLDNKSSVPSKIIYRGLSIDTDVIQAVFARFEMVKPGDSVSRIKEINESGTVGLKVFRKKNNTITHYLLTNYHVAAFDLLRLNQFIYKYPPNIDNRQILVPSQRQDPSNEEFIGAFSEGRLSTFYDIALIALDDEDDATNTIDGFSITDYTDVQLDDFSFKGAAVTLYGASSGKKINTIVSVHSHQVFNYAGGNSIGQFELLQINKFSQPGDSGSPVLLNNKIIGIHVGADDQFSYAIPIKRILDFYNLKISQP